jgi:DNA-binding NarL/FixJ family response regulator
MLLQGSTSVCIGAWPCELEVELTQLSRSGHTSVRLAQRAGIVLLAAQGLQNKEIAAVGRRAGAGCALARALA